jgi:hypothetical protein
MRRSNTDGIAQCGMSRATLEATGRQHWVATCSGSPQRPPGQQANKQQSTNAPKKVAVLMAMATCRYVTLHIAQWRRFRALLDATKKPPSGKYCGRSLQSVTHEPVFYKKFHRQLIQKGRRLTLRPLFSIGVLHIKQKRRA